MEISMAFYRDKDDEVLGAFPLEAVSGGRNSIFFLFDPLRGENVFVWFKASTEEVPVLVYCGETGKREAMLPSELEDLPLVSSREAESFRLHLETKFGKPIVGLSEIPEGAAKVRAEKWREWKASTAPTSPTSCLGGVEE